MRHFTRLPLYMGLSLLVLAILLTVIKIGEKGSIDTRKILAIPAASRLSLKFSPPDLISVLVVSDFPIAGTDIVLKFDGNNIAILPSTLTSGPSFVTSGGIIDTNTNESTFSFSGLTTKEVTNGIVASFNISPVNKSVGTETAVAFVEGEGKTVIIDKTSGANLGVSTSDLKFTINPK